MNKTKYITGVCVCIYICVCVCVCVCVYISVCVCVCILQPGNYVATVQRTPNCFQVCEDVVACFKDRARVERHYAQQLKEWSSKWKSIIDNSEDTPPGHFIRNTIVFFKRYSLFHIVIIRLIHSLAPINSHQSTHLHQSTPSHQDPAEPRESGARARQGEYTLSHQSTPTNQLTYTNQLTHTKIQQNRERAAHERDKARDRYEKVLDDVTGYAPRYMEEMESVFDQSQEQERKRISFLKQTFLSIHRHLDVTNNDSIKAVYSELHHTLMSICEQDDLRWWRNNHGPGMTTDWPSLQEWVPPVRKKKPGKKPKPVTVDTKAVMIGGVRVKALYDYVGEEADELSFKAGEEFLKVEDEDEQGWCRGVKEGGVEGFYPANYAHVVQGHHQDAQET
uniref:SH3 domain-containing protein n=1 Tax=Astyanax mexicanus TaxID=7994 RepID=A0A8B9HB59_ASTMX